MDAGSSISGMTSDATVGPLSTSSSSSATLGTTMAASTSANASSGDMCMDLEGQPCSVWNQNCPEGQKCAPYAECGAPYWTTAICIPIMENPAQPGDPCFAVGEIGGIDNCDMGSYCWHRNERGTGTCVLLCKGSGEAPYCEDPESACVVDSGESTLGWCLSRCDPLKDDCAHPQENCVPQVSDFVCWPILPDPGQPVHGTCMQIEACEKGLVCIASNSALECDQDALGCCEPYCDLTVPDPNAQCPSVGQACVPFFEGSPPPGDEDVGVCAIPG